MHADQAFDEPWTREGLLRWKAKLESGDTRMPVEDRTNALAYCEDELRKLEAGS